MNKLEILQQNKNLINLIKETVIQLKENNENINYPINPEIEDILRKINILEIRNTFRINKQLIINEQNKILNTPD